MNMQRSLIRQFMFYQFELSHNVTEATKEHSLSQYSNQMIQGISFVLQETRWSSKIK